VAGTPGSTFLLSRGPRRWKRRCLSAGRMRPGAGLPTGAVRTGLAGDHRRGPTLWGYGLLEEGGVEDQRFASGT